MLEPRRNLDNVFCGCFPGEFHDTLAFQSCSPLNLRLDSGLRSPPTPTFPLEIVEIIIAHLVYDRHDLCACSLACYSWHIAAVPHLHHTLITHTNPWL